MYKIYVRHSVDIEHMKRRYADVEDIQQRLHCAIATAYRIMRLYAVAQIYDIRKRKPYRVMPRAMLDELAVHREHCRRGNPRFGDSSFQRRMAYRSHKKHNRPRA